MAAKPKTTMHRRAVTVERRRPFTKKQKLKIYAKQADPSGNVVCPVSGIVIALLRDGVATTKHPHDFDHVIPRAIGGRRTIKNGRAIARVEAHKEKTKADRKVIAHVNRLRGKGGQLARRKKHGSKLKTQGFRKDIRRKMNGAVERIPTR